MVRQIFQTARDRAGANRFGLWLFLTALCVLFVAALLAMLAIRLETDDWPTDLPPLPGLIWLSTGLLLASTAMVQMAAWRCRRDRHGAARGLLVVALALAVAFLIVQSMAWLDWVGAFHDADMHRMAQSGFLILTGLHAAHVLGGLIPLSLVVWYAVVRGTVTSSLENMAVYWHFLDAVWIVLVLFMLCVL